MSRSMNPIVRVLYVVTVAALAAACGSTSSQGSTSSTTVASSPSTATPSTAATTTSSVVPTTTTAAAVSTAVSTTAGLQLGEPFAALCAPVITELAGGGKTSVRQEFSVVLVGLQSGRTRPVFGGVSDLSALEAISFGGRSMVPNRLRDICDGPALGVWNSDFTQAIGVASTTRGVAPAVVDFLVNPPVARFVVAPPEITDFGTSPKASAASFTPDGKGVFFTQLTDGKCVHFLVPDVEATNPAKTARSAGSTAYPIPRAELAQWAIGGGGNCSPPGQSGGNKVFWSASTPIYCFVALDDCVDSTGSSARRPPEARTPSAPPSERYRIGSRRYLESQKLLVFVATDPNGSYLFAQPEGAEPKLVTNLVGKDISIVALRERWTA